MDNTIYAVFRVLDDYDGYELCLGVYDDLQLAKSKLEELVEQKYATSKLWVGANKRWGHIADCWSYRPFGPSRDPQYTIEPFTLNTLEGK